MKSLLSKVSFTATAAIISLLIGNEAQAGSLVPQMEGEIDVGLGCLSGCIATPGFTSITSLVDATTTTKSRLFVDLLTTANTYGAGAVKFQAGDLGTVPSGFWFRPSEVQPDGTNEEIGQLEVGTFEFVFSQVLDFLTVDYFDTESNAFGSAGTQVLSVNGTSVAGAFAVPSGSNSNIYSQTFSDVQSIIIAFGQDYQSGTGDGVDFRMSTPEPVSMLGLGLAAGVGLLVSKKKALGA